MTSMGSSEVASWTHGLVDYPLSTALELRDILCLTSSPAGATRGRIAAHFFELAPLLHVRFETPNFVTRLGLCSSIARSLASAYHQTVCDGNPSGVEMTRPGHTCAATNAPPRLLES